MVLDTPAVVAIAMDEPPAPPVKAALATGEVAIIGAPTLLEVHMVLRAKAGDSAERVVAATLRRYDVAVVPFGESHLAAARRGFDLFGEGRHPARSSYGDRLSYALARVSGQRFLHVGDDFALTDVRGVGGSGGGSSGGPIS